MRRTACSTSPAPRPGLPTGRLGGVTALLVAVALVSGGAAPSASAAPPASAGATATDVGTPTTQEWRDWSWDSSTGSRGPGAALPRGVLDWRVHRPWGGLYLHAERPTTSTGSTTLRLSVRGAAPSSLGVVLFGDDLRPRSAPVRLTRLDAQPTGDAWTTYTGLLTDLGAPIGTVVTGVAVQDLQGSAPRRIGVQGVRLERGAGGAGAADTARTEIRPGNAQANATRGRPTDPRLFSGYEGFRPYYARIDGDFTGTTEEVLEWAAAKWGFDRLGVPDLAKAVAVQETWWRQGHVGRSGELGIVQVHPGAWPDAAPAAWSTAYAADYGMAVIRHHYDGKSWLGDATRGDLPAAVAAWECGCARPGGGWYDRLVFESLRTKPWLRPGVAPEWF